MNKKNWDTKTLKFNSLLNKYKLVRKRRPFPDSFQKYSVVYLILSAAASTMYYLVYLITLRSLTKMLENFMLQPKRKKQQPVLISRHRTLLIRTRILILKKNTEKSNAGP